MTMIFYAALFVLTVYITSTIIRRTEEKLRESMPKNPNPYEEIYKRTADIENHEVRNRVRTELIYDALKEKDRKEIADTHKEEKTDWSMFKSKEEEKHINFPYCLTVNEPVDWNIFKDEDEKRIEDRKSAGLTIFKD